MLTDLISSLFNSIIHKFHLSLAMPQNTEVIPRLELTFICTENVTYL